MVSVSYSEAAVEVLDILNHTNKEDVEKIPKKFIKFLKDNSNKNYISNIDYTKPIAQMNLKPKTQAILGLIYMKYWATEEGKYEFKQRIKENEIKYQQELREKYNVDNLFKNSKASKEIVDLPVVIQEETVLQKIINKIKSYIRR